MTPETIQPSSVKALFASLIGLGIPAVLILGLLLFMGFIIDFEAVATGLQYAGIDINITHIFLILCLVAAGIVAGYALWNMMTLLGTRVDVYDQQLEYVNGIQRITIPFQNLAQITYHKKGISSFLKAGTISIRVTNMKQTNIDIPFITDPELKVHQVQQRLQFFQRTQQTYNRMSAQGW